MEVWKDISGYEGLYQVSNMGNVRGLVFNNNQVVGKEKIHPIAKTDNGRGYHIVSLRKNGKRKNEYVHRIVAMAFLEKPDGKNYINHLDYDKHNNCVENLEWCTQSENVCYSRKHMMHQKSARIGESGYKYIRFRKSHWLVTIRALNRKIRIEGKFPTLEEAIRFRDDSLRRIGYGA